MKLKFFNLRNMQIPSKQNLTCIFLSVRAILKETFQCETPCSNYTKKRVNSRPFHNSCLSCKVVHVQTFGRYLRVELIPRTVESSMFFSSRKILLQTRLDCERFLNNIDFRILLLQHKTKGTMTKKK